VRSYLIRKLEQALVEWRLDGFKLDFIDFFTLESGISSPAIACQDGRDYISVPEAVERLLGDMIDRLTVHHRDVLIEFRQTYIGPVMRRFGNMFRATDCPNDAIENRVRTVDIRLLCGNTAVHSDMTMWHPGEPVESAALQLINALFSVPQISVRLEELPPAHSVMLNYWLQFWRNHRDVLLDGELLPLHPELLYPVVSARSPNKQIIVVYAEMVIKPDERLKEIIIVNGCREEGVFVDLATNRSEARLLITDCCGNQVLEQLYSWTRGLHWLPVPPAGVCHFIIESIALH
jgi:alpha-galactosidase